MKSKEGRCKHFTGINDDKCAAGVQYRELVGGEEYGWGARIPCVTNSLTQDPVSCDSHQDPTPEEIKADGEALKKTFGDVMTARAHILKMIDKHGVSHGRTQCPVCTDGILSFTQAQINNHIHASCSTEGCVSWME